MVPWDEWRKGREVQDVYIGNEKYVLREPKDFCRSVMNENFEKDDMPG